MDKTPAGQDAGNGIHPLLASRWSPVGFDADHVLDPGAVELLIEAARWAPSAGNSQPWSFVVGRRGDRVHRQLVAGLTAGSRRWAPSAGLLIANLCHVRVADTDWEYSEFAHYDLGQAVAHLTVQARALGLYVRQFRAFDRAALTAALGVPDHWEVTTMSAVGRLPGGSPPVTGAGRDRRSRADLLWSPPGLGDGARQPG